MTINYRHTEPGTGAAYFAYRGLVNSGAETGNLSVTAFVAGWNAAMATMEEKKNPVGVDVSHWHTFTLAGVHCTVCGLDRAGYPPAGD